LQNLTRGDKIEENKKDGTCNPRGRHTSLIFRRKILQGRATMETRKCGLESND